MADVLANAFLCVNALINEDLPTFERPIKAYSGILPSGHLATVELLIINFASLIIIIYCFLWVIMSISASLNFIGEPISCHLYK